MFSASQSKYDIIHMYLFNSPGPLDCLLFPNDFDWRFSPVDQSGETRCHEEVLQIISGSTCAAACPAPRRGFGVATFRICSPHAGSTPSSNLHRRSLTKPRSDRM
jgi:hypothetical protein